ncbi:MAG: preprotein translocase subunit YajC [Deltaproteobacteria bacterium CG_4_9_14_3_um_filter_63_12]|nr:MAG: preprotein translocase subunit YajC [Deltaproteobacteria bacterium CG_4_9_14_3_um_filter_63_12]
MMDPLIAGVAQGGDLAMMLPLVLIFGVFYFLVIRPQSKQRAAKEKMLSELKKGDKVVTGGGLLGVVSGVADGVVTLVVSDKVRIRVLQSHILGLETEAAKKTSPEK